MSGTAMNDEKRLGTLAKRSEDGFSHVMFLSFVLSEISLA